MDGSHSWKADRDRAADATAAAAFAIRACAGIRHHEECGGQPGQAAMPRQRIVGAIPDDPAKAEILTSLIEPARDPGARS